MIGYKVFNSEQDFIDWQNAADERQIYSMSPVAIEMHGQVTDTNFTAGPCFGIFVTYVVPANV